VGEVGEWKGTNGQGREGGGDVGEIVGGEEGRGGAREGWWCQEEREERWVGRGGKRGGRGGGEGGGEKSGGSKILGVVREGDNKVGGRDGAGGGGGYSW